MINELKDTPNTMIGFRATGEIRKEDFDKIVLPALAELLHRSEKLNYLLVSDAPLQNLNFGRWLKEAVTTLNQGNKWNRAAIVTSFKGHNVGTDLSDGQLPGEVKYFEESQLQEAIKWVGEQQGEDEVMPEEGTAKD